MTKFSSKENATRKDVFSTIRRNQNLTDSDLKREFGRSKLVLQSIMEARKRIADGQPSGSEHHIFFEPIKKNAETMARCLPSSGYSMGEYKKITNRLFGLLSPIYKYNPSVITSYDNTQEYRGGRYKATHGEVRAELPINILAKGEVMDGMITIRTKQIQKRIWKCQWIVWDYERNKRGFITTTAVGYHMESGYVVRREEGFGCHAGWFHCDTLSQARENLAHFIENEKDLRKIRIKDERERKAKEKEEKRRQREREKADRQERMTVMAHRKNYTQKDANRTAWKIFGMIATRQESCLYCHVWFISAQKYGYKLNINDDDAFERDVRTAFENICKEHDVAKELSKHNSREKQAKHWSERPVNILQHEMVRNFGQALFFSEKVFGINVPYGMIYAYNQRDKKIFTILAKMFRRQMAAKHEAVAKSNELADGLQHMYVYRDSILAGNCAPGTDGFLADHGLQKTDTRSGEFLL